MVETKTQRLYTIPLTDAWKVPYKRRAKKAVALIQKFAERHMKADPKNVRVGTQLNEAIWARGIKFPPRKVKVQAIPQEIDVKGKKSTNVWIELEGVKLELGKKKAEAPKKKDMTQSAKPSEQSSKDEAKPEVKAEEKKADGSKAEAKEAPNGGEKKDAHKHEEKKAASDKK